MNLYQQEKVAPTLMIGHHLLEGKIVNLSKPLAVLRKRTNIQQPLSNDGSSDGDPCSEANDQALAQRSGVSYDIQAVVKRKLLFSKRPVPIVGATIPMTGEVSASSLMSMTRAY